MELTPEIIVEFLNEAEVMANLSHPNLVALRGVSVAPPAISLLTKFCSRGSLFDFLHSPPAELPHSTVERDAPARELFSTHPPTG
ncbi:unnamed protein product, partial [Discosporangium mesarthrocarpum]